MSEIPEGWNVGEVTPFGLCTCALPTAISAPIRLNSEACCLLRAPFTEFLSATWLGINLIVRVRTRIAQPGHLASTHIISICIVRTSSGVDLRATAACNAVASDCIKSRSQFHFKTISMDTYSIYRRICDAIVVTKLDRQ